MKAKDIMTKNVVFVSPFTSMREIYNIFSKERYGGVPVIDEDKHVLGIITKAEILSVLIPDYFDMLGENIMFIDDFGSMEQEFEKLPTFELFVAEDIMKKVPVTIDEDVSVLKVIAIMKINNIRRVLVTKDNILTGIVTRGDICRAFFERS